MESFGSTKILIDQTKIREKNPSLEVTEVALVQCNLLDNQYQQKSVVFLKTFNTEFDEIIKTFTDQNGRPLEIEDKVNLTLLINK